MLELHSQGSDCSRFAAMVAHIFGHVSCLLKCKNVHGIHFAAGEKVPLCGKVLTCGILAKKEVVWHDLPAIFHHLAKKEGGWCDLENLPEILYFFVDQSRLNAP